ncbi:MAG: type VII secretion target [Actinomadura sp.]
MGDGFEVKRTDLDAHASQVNAVAGRVDKANAAAKESTLGGWGMYGLLCSPIIVPALAGFFGDSDDLVKKSAELGHAMSDALQTTRKNYDAIEQAIEDMIKEIG